RGRRRARARRTPGPARRPGPTRAGALRRAPRARPRPHAGRRRRARAAARPGPRAGRAARAEGPRARPPWGRPVAPSSARPRAPRGCSRSAWLDPSLTSVWPVAARVQLEPLDPVEQLAHEQRTRVVESEVATQAQRAREPSRAVGRVEWPA